MTYTISIVIPAYNEEVRLGNTLKKILDYFKTKTQEIDLCEIIVVDDGSSDGTVNIVKGFFEEHPIKLIKNERNRGKGYAIKVGMLATRGQYVLFTDADLSVPIEEIDKVIVAVKSGYELIIGSRKIKDSNIQIHQPFYREFMGKIFTLLTQLLLNLNLSDFTCGFKCFKQSIVNLIFEKQLVADWSFDAEIMFIAHRKKIKLKEIPVVWYDSRGSKVRLFRDTMGAFLGLIKTRINAIMGRYS